ncbi:unnamed protein product [Caenorhabditis brenneri]
MPRRLAFFSPFHYLRMKKYKLSPPPPSSPETFPFLKLPHFPLKYVINQMELVDVIYLTMKYKRFKRAVESAKFYVDQLHFHPGKWFKDIVITHQGQDLEIEAKYTEGGFRSTGMKLNGIATPICYTRMFGIKVFAESEEAKMDVLDKITQHLLSILWVRKFTARFNIKCDFENLFIWKYTKKFRQGMYRNGNFWIPNTCGNRLLKEWIAGKNDKLEEMTFQVKELFEGPDSNEDLLEGITTTVNTLSEKQLDKRQVWRHGLRVPIIDIKRSTDGRLATISRWKYLVFLYVWHPKHIDELKDVVEASGGRDGRRDGRRNGRRGGRRNGRRNGRGTRMKRSYRTIEKA